MSGEHITVGKHRILLARSARRRTTSLEIANGIVKLRCPKRAQIAHLVEFAQSKEQWLNKHQKVIGPPPPAINITDGMQVSLLEHDYHVRFDYGNSGEAVINLETCDIRVPLARCKNIEHAVERKLTTLFKQTIKQYIDHRIIELSRVMNASVKSTKVKDYKRRWGSCDRKANLTFNWRLVFAPRKIVDYVIVHELAHITVFNHSPKFWHLVSLYYPNYLAAKEWIHTNGQHLYRFARQD